MKLYTSITIFLFSIIFNAYSLELKGENDSNEDIPIIFALYVFKISKNTQDNGQMNTLSIQYGGEEFVISSIKKLDFHQTLIKTKRITIKKKTKTIDFESLGFIPPNNKYLLPLPLIHSKHQYVYCFYYNINNKTTGMILDSIDRAGIVIKIDKHKQHSVEYF